MMFGLAVGWAVESHGYGPAFVAAGLFHPAAFLVILYGVPRVRLISHRDGTPAGP
jgi:hypothetical protein